jgi:UDP-GlcNAc:undecaprenyl-phosphate GlcNAc-1-phosphate transferase
LAIYCGFAVALLVGSTAHFFSGGVISKELWGILGGATALALLGAADDIWDLDWMAKLAGQILVGGLLAWSGVQLISFPIAGVTIGSSRLSLFATIIVVVVAVNAVNFVDGLDGLAAGMLAISAFAFFVYAYQITRALSPMTYSSLATFVLAALVGACIGFLPHNFYPARIFMGDSGSMVLGFVIAAAAIRVTGQIDPQNLTTSQAFPAFLPIALPFAVLAIPLIDMMLAIIRRVKLGKSPFQADKSHLHHRLLDLGHSHRGAVLILWVWTAVLSFTAAGLVIFSRGGVLIFFAVGIVVAALLTIGPLRHLRNDPPPATVDQASVDQTAVDQAATSSATIDPPDVDSSGVHP